MVAIKAITKKNLAKSQNLLGKEIKILKVSEAHTLYSMQQAPVTESVTETLEEKVLLSSLIQWQLSKFLVPLWVCHFVFVQHDLYQRALDFGCLLIVA